MPYQISNIDDVVAIAAGETRSLAVKRDGTVWEWTSESPAYGNAGVAAVSPRRVMGLDGVVAVSVAYEAWMGTLVDSRTVALKGDGTVWAWHAGEGSTAPVRVGALDRIVAISAASAGDVALRDDGTVWEWDDGLIPVQVSGLDGVVAVANGTSGSGWVRRRADLGSRSSAMARFGAGRVHPDRRRCRSCCMGSKKSRGSPRPAFMCIPPEKRQSCSLSSATALFGRGARRGTAS
jgi:alpha-tubulin suppressor-like RCC1 family protein